MAAARKAGFKNLSLDLIYGLPGQTMQQWEDTLAAVIALAPEHLSCYGLKLEPGTPLYDRAGQLSAARTTMPRRICISTPWHRSGAERL